MPEEARHAGFAFVQPMPFELNDLLAQVASTIQPVLSAEHEQQVQVVERFFTAREQEDWQALIALCTEEVACYPPTSSDIQPAGRRQGQAALHTHLASATQVERRLLFLDRYYAGLPKGLLVRYVRLWATPEEERRREAMVGFFHFRGEYICQMGRRPLMRHRQAHRAVG